MIYVIGGGGVLGQRVVRELEAAPQPGVSIVAASKRSRACRVDVRHPQEFVQRLEKGDVVIDAVGPYRHDPTALVRGCLAAQAHYIDLSHDPHFNLKVRSACAQLTPRSCVITGCSTIPGMADALMPLLARPGVRVIRRHVLLSMGTRYPISRSMLYGLLRPLGRREGAVTWGKELAMRELGDGRLKRYTSAPAAWPLRETRLWLGFDHGIYVYGLRAMSALVRLCSDKVLWALCALSWPLVCLLRMLGTQRSSLRLELTDENSSVRALEVRAHADGLSIAALPAAWAAQALVSMDPEEQASGDMAFADLMSAKALAGHLQQRGHVVQVRREVTYS